MRWKTVWILNLAMLGLGTTCLLGTAVANGDSSLTETMDNTEVVESTDSELPKPHYLTAEAQPQEELERLMKADTITQDERAVLEAELSRTTEILRAQENAVRLVAKLVEPCVVHIQSRILLQNTRTVREEEGSGVIFARNNELYVLTNRHVLGEATINQIEIHLYDKRIIRPKRVWRDAETDIAVMHIDETGLIPAKLGDSTKVEIGEFVLAVGSPFGLSHSVTFGIISAKGRRSLDINGTQGAQMQDFLQTDAAINPGNSGGPLVNLNGEVIAINTAIASSSGHYEGIGFSIPIQMATQIAEQLITLGRVRHAYLGVTLDTKFSNAKARQLGLERPIGACVEEISPNSPAAAANFARNDVILLFNEIIVQDDKHLYNLVNLADTTKAIPVSVFRNGKIYKIEVRILER